MNNESFNPKTIFGADIAINMEAGLSNTIAEDTRTHGLDLSSALLSEGDQIWLQAVSAKSLEDIPQEILERLAGLEALAPWLDGYLDISTEASSRNEVRFYTEGHHYLLFGADEKAVTAWSPEYRTIDLTKLQGQQLTILTEDMGVLITFGKEPAAYSFPKTGAAMPSVSKVIQAMGSDTELREYLLNQLIEASVLDAAIAVGAVYTYCNALSLADNIALMKRGEAPTHEEAATNWIRALNGDQIEEILDLADGQFLQLHESVDDLEELSSHDPMYEQLFSYLAIERSRIDGLFTLLRAANIRSDSLQRLVDALDERAASLIPITPRLPELSEHLIAVRAAERRPDTWWGRLVP